jgi:PIN domain nuclease of toxin-antitoxin system
MKYLIDTHALIWLIENPTKRSSEARTIIESRKNKLYLSSASLWEIAIKVGLGKLNLKRPFEQLLADLGSTNITILQIANDYLLNLATLPDIHKDPFDRLLVATATAEKFAILTADENIHKYDVEWVW